MSKVLDIFMSIPNMYSVVICISMTIEINLHIKPNTDHCFAFPHSLFHSFDT